jgi:hypothetical protein
MRLFLAHVLHTVWCLFKSYAHSNNYKKQLVKRRKKQKKNTTAQIGTNVTSPGLLARSQFAFGSSCYCPSSSRANAELVPKFHVALHASHVALPVVTLKISPYTNMTLGWITLFVEDMGEGALH